MLINYLDSNKQLILVGIVAKVAIEIPRLRFLLLHNCQIIKRSIRPGCDLSCMPSLLKIFMKILP